MDTIRAVAARSRRSPNAFTFRADGKLSFDAPTANEGFDEYVSDPTKPVPYYNKITLGMSRPYMDGDQRFASRRTDVLTYETAPLDSDVTIAGPVAPTLHVSTTGTDSDFIVKLIDVYPDNYPDPDPNPTGVKMGGYEQLVRGEPFRGKFRHSFEHPEPFTPGKTEEIHFHDARRQSLLSTRPPNHGAGAELLVPAGGSQSPDIYKYSNRQTGGLQDGDRARLPLARKTELFGSKCDPVTWRWPKRCR